MMRRLAVAAAALLALGGAAAPDVSITVKDLTPKFLTFYRAAQDADPDARFGLWKKDYDFAAVPPTPQGDIIARRLLDDAWPRYPSVMDRIEKGADGIAPRPIDTLNRIVTLLHPAEPVHMT